MKRALLDLNHVRRSIGNGGEVYVLDRGSVISAESEAMLQALHSRSVGGFRSHLESLEKRGSEKFMSQFYVGYGHKSIGDCADATIFVEGVSMIAAKAIQNSRLYNGQEASTRYIDFSNQPFIDPTNDRGVRELQEDQRKFYLGMLEPIQATLYEIHSKQESEKPNIYKKAIEARSFDIARGLLPAGAATNLAWHTNLRQAGDHLGRLRNHPLDEVRGIAWGIEDALQEAHPNSFDLGRHKKSERYLRLVGDSHYFEREGNIEGVLLSNTIGEGIQEYRELLDARPPKTELPDFVGQAGTVTAEFDLDYGSFRDVQRQRAVIQRMPLLTAEHGFNSWYLENMPANERNKVEDHVSHVIERASELGLSRGHMQYVLPMGFNVPNKIVGDVPAMAYLAELRATRFVHPTLRNVAKDIVNYLENEVGVPLHLDPDPDRFDVKRGEHDIVLKKE